MLNYKKARGFLMLNYKKVRALAVVAVAVPQSDTKKPEKEGAP